MEDIYKKLYEREKLRNHYLQEAMKYEKKRDLWELEMYWNNRFLGIL